jgi:hypothetical protein
MHKKTIKALIAMVAAFSLSASAAVITDENFTGGANGWSNNATSTINGNEVLGGFNLFGAGAIAEKTFALSGTQSQVFIDLDFWKGDSWDGESFMVTANNNVLFSQSYMYYEGAQVAGQMHNLWNELLVPISLVFNTNATSLTLRFSSTLDQGANDEWWAVDNVRISDNASAHVPEPSTLGLLLLALGAVFAIRQLRKTA